MDFITLCEKYVAFCLDEHWWDIKMDEQNEIMHVRMVDDTRIFDFTRKDMEDALHAINEGE